MASTSTSHSATRPPSRRQNWTNRLTPRSCGWVTTTFRPSPCTAPPALLAPPAPVGRNRWVGLTLGRPATLRLRATHGNKALPGPALTTFGPHPALVQFPRQTQLPTRCPPGSLRQRGLPGHVSFPWRTCHRTTAPSSRSSMKIAGLAQRFRPPSERFARFQNLSSPGPMVHP